MEHTIDKTWFDARLIDLRMSQRQLARLLGKDPSSLSLLLTGKRRMTAEVASSLARVLGVTLDEVLAAAGIAEDQTRVPILGAISGDASVSVSDQPVGQAAVPCAVPSGTVAYHMRTAQSDLDMMHGWVAFAGEQQSADESFVDRTAIVKVEGIPDPLLRLVRRGSARGLFTLTGIGQSPLYDRRIEWARRVLIFRPI